MFVQIKIKEQRIKKCFILDKIKNAYASHEPEKI